MSGAELEKKPWRPDVYAGLEAVPESMPSAMKIVGLVQKLEPPALFLPEFRPTTFLLLMSCECGWTDDGLAWVGRNLSGACVTRDGQLLIREQVEDAGTKSVKIPLPPAAHLFVRACGALTNAPGNSVADWLGAPKHFDPGILAKSFAQLQTAVGVSQGMSLKNFSRCMRWLAVQKLPNLIVTLQSIEPGAEHYSPLFPLVGPSQLGDLTSQQAFKDLLVKDPLPIIQAAQMKTSMRPTNAEWRKDAEDVVDDIIERLRSIHAQEGKKGAGRLTKSTRALSETTALASERGFPKTSSATLAAEWAVERFNWKTAPNADSVRKYLGVIFSKGLFEVEGAFDLLDWDDDDWQEFSESVLGRAGTPDTREGYEDLLADFLAFASGKLGFDPVHIQMTLRTRRESIRRALLIRPSDLDAVARALKSRGTMFHKGIAAALLLAFYGGLRPKEVRTLTLIELCGDAEDLHVCIRRSKNKQSRRWINLSVLAPRWVCEFLVEFREARRGEFARVSDKANASLLGAVGEPHVLPAQAYIAPAMGYLKSVFGKQVVFYSLRHSFASWNFVRMMAFGFRGIRDELVDRHHETFSDDFLGRLRDVYAGVEFMAPAIPVTAVITLARMMGHSGYATLFERYVHTLSLVLPHVCSKWFKEQSQRKLSRKACAQLTGLKSSSSLAALPNTVGGLLKSL